MSVTAADIAGMRTDTAAVIASVGQSCTTHRAVKNGTTGQYTYGAAYRTDTLAIEPASEGMVIASHKYVFTDTSPLPNTYMQRFVALVVYALLITLAAWSLAHYGAPRYAPTDLSTFDQST